MENLNFESENNKLLQSSQINLIEIRRLSNFFQIFVENYQEIINNFQLKLQNTEVIAHDSILLTNINGLFQNFLPIMKNTENILSKIIIDIISPLEQFKITQHSIYQENLYRYAKIVNEYKFYKKLVEYTKK